MTTKIFLKRFKISKDKEVRTKYQCQSNYSKSMLIVLQRLKSHKLTRILFNINYTKIINRKISTNSSLTNYILITT